LVENNIQTRELNELEQFIIERIVKNTRRSYIEMFILFGILDLACLYGVFLVFLDNWLLGILFLVLVGVLSLFLVRIGTVIKDSKVKNAYPVRSEKGTWTITIEGDTAKTTHYVSKVNGKKIGMAVPEMVTPPTYSKPKEIDFEYVKILDNPPPFGNNYVFISIDGNELNEKHKNYIGKVKLVGVISIVLNACFMVSLLFSFISKFEIEFSVYLCMILFIPFARTIIFSIKNRRLKKGLTS